MVERVITPNCNSSRLVADPVAGHLLSSPTLHWNIADSMVFPVKQQQTPRTHQTPTLIHIYCAQDYRIAYMLEWPCGVPFWPSMAQVSIVIWCYLYGLMMAANVIWLHESKKTYSTASLQVIIHSSLFLFLSRYFCWFSIFPFWVQFVVLDVLYHFVVLSKKFWGGSKSLVSLDSNMAGSVCRWGRPE